MSIDGYVKDLGNAGMGAEIKLKNSLNILTTYSMRKDNPRYYTCHLRYTLQINRGGKKDKKTNNDLDTMMLKEKCATILSSVHRRIRPASHPRHRLFRLIRNTGTCLSLRRRKSNTECRLTSQSENPQSASRQSDRRIVLENLSIFPRDVCPQTRSTHDTKKGLSTSVLWSTLAYKQYVHASYVFS